MQANGESDPDTCAYNDLALVKIDPADVGKVNPSVPGFGGPTGVGGASAALDDVYSYGNSSLRFGITFLSPKFGKVVSTEGGGWSRTVYTVTPGIPGDSGSGFLNASGQAIGDAVHGRASRRSRRPTGSVTSAASWPTPARTARSPACSWRTAPRPFTPDVVGAIAGAG